MEPYQRLEREWAEFNGLDPAGMVACSSGTAALHLALEAFRLPPGSEVLVPDYAMIACPRAVALAGLTPVFVDCDERLLMNADLANLATLEHTVALMAVHVYGRRLDLGEMPRLKLKKNQYAGKLLYVEDLAEAHGVRPHPTTDAACWSFYRNKIVAGEEGGAVWFRDPEHAALARQLRSLGFTDAHDYDHVPRGHNYRMSNLHAERILTNWTVALPPDGYPAIGKVNWWRREIESWYDETCSPEWRQPSRDAVWVYDLRVSGEKRPDVLRAVRALRAEGVEARPGFLPMTAQEEFAGCWMVGRAGRFRQVKGTAEDLMTGAYRAADEVLYLPVQPGRTTPESVRLAFEVLRQELG